MLDREILDVTVASRGAKEGALTGLSKVLFFGDPLTAGNMIGRQHAGHSEQHVAPDGMWPADIVFGLPNLMLARTGSSPMPCSQKSVEDRAANISA